MKSSCATTITLGEKLTKEDVISKVVATLYHNFVGSLMYLTNTRSDIMYVMSLISHLNM